MLASAFMKRQHTWAASALMQLLHQLHHGPRAAQRTADQLGWGRASPLQIIEAVDFAKAVAFARPYFCRGALAA